MLMDGSKCVNTVYDNVSACDTWSSSFLWSS
uniref:Uncharacterized protein n=1 Tax=Anguilla anguilla TaxID=7936 RepID=A0A0E9VM31_ANGAN